jgi:hypothetical protein
MFRRGGPGGAVFYSNRFEASTASKLEMNNKLKTNT